MISIGPYLPWTYAESDYIIRFCPEAMSLELGLRWLNDRASPYSTPERMRRVYRHYVDCKNENERMKRYLVEIEYKLAKQGNSDESN
jgi:hypothetical protein